MTFGGVPVHGFATTASGAPTDSYGRSLYIDTFGSAYGPGGSGRHRSCFASRAARSVTRSGRRTTSRSPTVPRDRPGTDAKYRISVVGPGVTPDVTAETRDLGAYDPQVEKQQDVLFTRVIAGDKFCATQR